jgi:serine/threonine-protein kinase RsbW
VIVATRSQISLTFPAEAEYLRLVRLTSADVGSRAGFDYEEIDDLKIGASELCSLVLGAPGAIALVYTIEPGTVTIDGKASMSATHHENELSRTIIGAVVDEYSVSERDGHLHFRAVKRGLGRTS